jgi:acyl-CoA thioester hydrolase
MTAAANSSARPDATPAAPAGTAPAGAGPANQPPAGAVATSIQLRWADTDHYGHVNNVTWLRYVEEARSRTFGFSDLPQAAHPDRPPVLAVLGPATFTITAAVRLEYVGELAYHAQSILADVWLSRIGSKSIDMAFRFTDEARTTTYLLAQVTQVVCDLATRRPRPLTEAEVRALTPYQGAPLTFR